MTEVDAPFREIVGRHLNGHLIAGENSDAVLLHAASGVGNHLVPIVQLYASASVGQYLDHNAFELEHLFFRHQPSS